ncbi:ABC transporter permease subunit [Oceanirhabdus sp. W0125-5]|uniref:ABC transporter permease subunit n=1 Tax=Oceanirhabdus sp. W0125-5 TaxID=2999116 RepID=UPI0022F301F5|nr:ABC transporter permease [Oceanirhabdus sp. W0125-5]WBW99010.1 ABC transporter permease [Oceanirhabdus sp. W0125-5]
MKQYKFQIPQIIIMIFLLVMAGMTIYLGIPFPRMFNDSLIKLVMNGVLVLSLIPMLNCGVGMNFGIPVGVSAGLLGMCISINLRLKGILGFTGALFFSIIIGIVFGFVYSKILNRVKGREEIAGTFVGFSFIPLMSFFWTLAPFTNRQMLYPIGGKGLRPKIGLKNFFGKILNELWVIHIGDFKIPLGLLLFFLLICILIYLFFKTKTGMAMIAVGENETYATLSGISVNKMRTISIILSTVLAAVGICVYAQSYGFVELYEAPLMMAFPAVSAVLIGGSSGRKTSVVQAVVGVYLFQTTYVLSAPLANAILIPEMSEVLRMMITNIIILYALLYKGGRKKHGKK